MEKGWLINIRKKRRLANFGKDHSEWKKSQETKVEADQKKLKKKDGVMTSRGILETDFSTAEAWLWAEIPTE